MTAGAPVVVLGAGGCVGRALVPLLAGAGRQLRLGARRPGAVRPPAGASVHAVDVDRPEELARLVEGCRVVVNCAGSGPTVAPRVLATGAAYVDPGGDEPLRAALAGAVAGTGRTAVVGAGVLPGLSGLVPRWLLRGRPPGTWRLEAHAVAADRITPAAAVEMLLGLVDEDDRRGAAWRDGRLVPRALVPRAGLRPPFLPADLVAPEVVAYPYLGAETERVARGCGLAEALWWQVFDAGSRIPPALTGLAERLRRGEPPAAPARELSAAAELEMFGRPAGQFLAFELAGTAGGRAVTRSVLLRVADSYAATAVVTAATVAAVLDGGVPPGAHLAAEVLDPLLAPQLAAGPGSWWSVSDRPLPDGSQIEEGAL